MRKPTAVDLFCGCGGLTVGLKSAGFNVLGAVDNDLLSIETFKANHPAVQVWQADIREMDPSEIRDALGLRNERIDLLAGCPPCQGFSTIRTLNGRRTIEDSRNDLLFEFQRFIEGLMPRSVMLENVPGLVDDFRFREFCDRIKDLGYLGEYRVLNAADYGVPQRRRRLIYLAGKGEKIPFAGSMGWRMTVRDAIAEMPKSGVSGDPVHDFAENRSQRIKEMIKMIPKDGGSRKDLPEKYQLDCHKRCNGFKDVYGRMKWDDVAPTITSGCFNPSKGRYLHPEENRAITMREAAILQGFPRNYKFPKATNKSAIALLIGNALPPPLIAALSIPISDYCLTKIMHKYANEKRMDII